MRDFDFSALSFFKILLVSGNNAPLTAVVVIRSAIWLCTAADYIISKATLVLAGFGTVFSLYNNTLTDSTTRLFCR